MSKWDHRFLALAAHIADWSKDRSTQVGAVVIGPKKEIRAVGYNGFPRGVNDEIEERHQRPTKYAYTEHAERNAIYNASYTGTSLDGCALYVTHFPCSDCARAIIQAGIAEVYVDRQKLTPDFLERWEQDMNISTEMFGESGVQVKLIDGEGETLVLETENGDENAAENSVSPDELKNL
ncbi:deoxycytidylate deaminase [Thalassospira marina]|uniref:CMP deaminase n=1 Tax=Thalassospira marina TaxID=2048283 RepID=A0ABM6Q7Q6_9PROT|nr:dCMP deaminase family protein [Thalassospira marina]AUG52570.1 CMP deaminase [Thalassospira marina]